MENEDNLQCVKLEFGNNIKSKKQESQKNNIQLIVARSNTTKPFDPAEKTLDLVPSLVKLCAQETGHTVSLVQDVLTRKDPEKSLLAPLQKTGSL